MTYGRAFASRICGPARIQCQVRAGLVWPGLALVLVSSHGLDEGPS